MLSWRGPGHPHAGGAEISTHEHAKGWVRAGHNVTLFTSYYKGAKREEVIDGVSILRNSCQFIGVQWEAFKWYLFGKHIIFDLVIDQFHGIPFFTPVYVKGKKLAFIHEVTKEVWGLNPWFWPFNLIPAFFGKVFEPLIFKLFYRKIPFMTVSESTKKDLIEWGIPEDNIAIIHNGISEPSIDKLPDKETKKTVIYLGALAKDKGIEDALQVFSILKAFSDWQFWVVGKANPGYFNKLIFLSEKLLLGGRVKFWGYVNEQEKFKLLARAHTLINPSVREGWGLVVIEAAKVGTPTVAYNVAGLKDSIINEKTGILCECTPRALAAKTKELLANNTNYSEIRKNAIIWSKRFSWEKSTRLSLKLIESL